MFLLLWIPTPAISRHDLGGIIAFLPCPTMAREIVIWYADVVYRVLQAEANTSAKQPIVATDLCRSSNYTGCHGFWEHAKWNIEEFFRQQQQKKIKTPTPSPQPCPLLHWGHSLWGGRPLWGYKKAPPTECGSFSSTMEGFVFFWWGAYRTLPTSQHVAL